MFVLCVCVFCCCCCFVRWWWWWWFFVVVVFWGKGRIAVSFVSVSLLFGQSGLKMLQATKPPAVTVGSILSVSENSARSSESQTTDFSTNTSSPRHFQPCQCTSLYSTASAERASTTPPESADLTDLRRHRVQCKKEGSKARSSLFSMLICQPGISRRRRKYTMAFSHLRKANPVQP